MVKNLPADAGDTGSNHRPGRFPGEGSGNPPPCSCPGKSHGRGSLAGYGAQGLKKVRLDLATKQQQFGKQEFPKMVY